jgi:DNA integrity scanning protein DisA with diadenylate cyclase activity
VRDEEIVVGLFSEAGLPTEIAEAIARTVQSMSELRKGALILIPDDESSLPATVGQIDTSALASLLNAQIEQASFLDMFRANATMQVLSSDGITVVSKSGRLLACGRIIDLTGVTGAAGGGRTQAATAASRFGLAVKISADGPISAYRNGVKILSV